MGALFQTIRRAVEDERFVVGVHADDRIRERRMVEWQIASGILDGELIAEHERDTPNPSVEVRQLLADGTPYKAVWSWNARRNRAKLVTVHFFDRRLRVL